MSYERIYTARQTGVKGKEACRRTRPWSDEQPASSVGRRAGPMATIVEAVATAFECLPTRIRHGPEEKAEGGGGPGWSREGWAQQIRSIRSKLRLAVAGSERVI